MAEDERTRRWQRISFSADPVMAMRAAIASLRSTPRDPEARRRLHALAAEPATAEQLALLLADEARAATRPEVAAACFEELVDIYENLDQPLETIAAMEALVRLEPDDVEHHDRLAKLYHRAGAWAKAAEAFERVASLARDDRARAALRAAGRLYRDNSRLDQAVAAYRAIVARRPSDLDAWRALDELLAQLGRWREVAEVRGVLAESVATGVDKAVLLRAQARALEQAGDAAAAAELVASAAGHAPEDVSGLVDYAQVLVRDGRGRDAADLIAARVAEAVAKGAPSDEIAALRFRLAGVLDEACADRAAALAVLEELLDAAPDYLPALERIAHHAAHDPRAHATALLRHAAAVPDLLDRAALSIEAARRFRDARDAHETVRAFEAAYELLPDDRDVQRELDDARTALAVERAAAETTIGDTTGAEHRLRAILGAQPHSLSANLALADLLVAGDRIDEAADHLQATLAAAPVDTPPAKLAPLVHRYAVAVAARGDANQAHQLLHEAHHLARRDFAITLALGESCFARKLWREAAIHLGSLAEHPDAPAHAATVANGLVHAAQAEVRALRATNAVKHYEAAARLDPGCAPAWHALAEVATERGDMNRAAECLEREANATTDPRDRRRLFDALGDLALDVLGDAARAERCWIPIADDVPILDKLLKVQRRRGAGAERAATCERLAALTGDKRIQKELLEEAAAAYAAGGEARRARDSAQRLIAAHPLDLDAVACASAIAADDAAPWLRRALAAWDAAGDRGDGDPRRADLWRRLGDAERARANEAGALAAYERAISTAPDSEGARAARRGLVELAKTGGRPAGESLGELVAADQEVSDVIAWARELALADHREDARAMFELARALGAQLTVEDEQLFARDAPRAMASDQNYAAPLDELERRALIDGRDLRTAGSAAEGRRGSIDDEAEGPLGEVLAVLGDAIALVCPDAKSALDRAGLSDASRVSATADAAIAALYPQIANALGGPQTLLYSISRGPDLTLLLAAPPVVVIGPRLAAIRGDADHTELRFELGRIVELARPRRLLAAGSTPVAFSNLVAAVRDAFDRANKLIGGEAERLRQVLPIGIARRLTERIAELDTADPRAYLAACERAADRSGLLACGHVGVAIELAGGPITARHLVKLAASPRYLDARRKLWSRRA